MPETPRPHFEARGERWIGHAFHIARSFVGEPAATLARLARANRVDMIVMGSHGRGAWNRLLLGSVVQRVLALSRVPLLVIR